MDNGLTWNKTLVNQFPIPLYDIGPMITDIDNDGFPDSVGTVDPSNTLVIDNNDIVHVWAGRSSVIDEDTILNIGGYYPFVGGLLYWNENMPPNTILNNVIAVTEDLNNDGILNIPDSIVPLSVNATSMATAGVNAWDHLFVAYSSYIEDTINPFPSPLEAKRNIYLMKSTDNGQSWSTPFRICPEDLVDQIYPSMSEIIYDDPRIIYFRDTTPQYIFDHHIEVIYMSPDISTSIENITLPTIIMNVWQEENEEILNFYFKNEFGINDVSIEVYDISGRLITKQSTDNINNTVIKKINMNGCVSGIYFIRMLSNIGTEVKKFNFKNIK